MNLFTQGTTRREETLQGAVQSVVYQSRDGFFSVVRLRREADGQEVVAVGDLGSVSEGEVLRLRGHWTTHQVHGKRFQTLSFTPVLPTSLKGITRYLGSGLIPGIGKGLAQRLVDRFGDGALEVIATQSMKLTEVPGIGRRRAEAIAAAVRERRDEAEVMSYLHSLGIGPALAKRVRKRYRDEAVRVLREDPYRVAEEVAGVGFRTADRIGRASGMAVDDPRRAAGAVLHLLGAGADDGHVFLTREQLAEQAEALEVPPEVAEDVLGSLAARGLVVLEDDAVYASTLHQAEVEVADRLTARIEHAMTVPAGLDARIATALPEQLSVTQQRAVRATFEAALVIITGGPGTGKTTTVRGVVQAHEALGHSLLLCAPTGRAAKRLHEASGHEAKTIHRLLEWSPATGRFQRDESNPVEADLVLVDEASMLNLQLARSLFAAIPPHIPLVLVGDVDQLPPVGPGQVLRNALHSERANTVRLNEVFRQAEQSHIVRGAHQILRGEMPQPSPAGTKGDGELFVVRNRDPDQTLDRLHEMLQRLPKAYGLDPRRDVMVLSPMRRGPLGTERLNAYLQERLNPAGKGSTTRPGTARAGDKVMQLRNDYEKEAYNGDLGEVRSVEGGMTYVRFDGREVRYKVDERDDLALAYASTVHKVQGSEFPAVIICLHASHHVLLSRALLYTAVTRAKRLVVLLGDERAIGRAAKNAHSYSGQSRLMERLKAATTAS